MLSLADVRETVIESDHLRRVWGIHPQILSARSLFNVARQTEHLTKSVVQRSVSGSVFLLLHDIALKNNRPKVAL